MPVVGIYSHEYPKGAGREYSSIEFEEHLVDITVVYTHRRQPPSHLLP